MGRWVRDDDWSRQLGRRLGLLALVWSAVYLVWRVGWSWRDPHGVVSPWLAVPAIAIELLGFLALVLLMRALWHGTSATSATSARSDGTGTSDGPDTDVLLACDIAVVTRDHHVEDIRATLVAARLDQPSTGLIVVDHLRRAELADIATEFGARYLNPTSADTTGVAAIVAAGGPDWFVMLDGGDIPAADLTSRLLAVAHQTGTAAVQCVVASTPSDSAEHTPSGRHDLHFERSVLNPSLGACGVGFLAGTGSLLRRSALVDVEMPTGSRHDVFWQLTPLLLAAGYRVRTIDGVPLVAARPLSSSTTVAVDRDERAGAGWRLVVGGRGALRTKGLAATDRMRIATWAVRPLEGVRRCALIIVLLAALVAGRSPFTPSIAAVLTLWAPAFVLASVALLCLSAGALRPGDRLRGSVKSVKLALALAIGINIVLVMRGISDRFTHGMHPMSAAAQVGLVLAVLWVLAGCLDALRLLAHRHDRRAVRLTASTTGRLGDQAVSVADVNMLGAGLLAGTEPSLGDRRNLVFSLPSASGITTLDVPSVVMNVRPHEAGMYRVGVEFDLSDPFALDTLAECCVVLPARAGMVPTSGRSSIGHTELETAFEDDVLVVQGPRRLSLRLATLLALGGVISSAAPLGAQAVAPSVRTVSGVVALAEPAAPDATLTTPAATTVVVATTDPGASLPIAPVPADSVSTPITAMSTSGVTTDPLPLGSAAAGPLVSDPTSTDSPLSVDVGGITVVGACSLDAGADGAFGTADDVYGPTVNTLTNPDGSYSLTLDGDACWISIAPPVPGVAVVDASTSAPATTAATSAIGDPPAAETIRVVGLGHAGKVRMPTVLMSGAALASRANAVPAAGVGRVTGASAMATLVSFGATLPTPSAAQVRHAPVQRGGGLLTMLVIVAACVLAASVLFASARPLLGRPQS